MSERKIGVYICRCGGNISDYVDVDRVLAAVVDEPGVAVARTAMFTCSDATQQEIVDDIGDKQLDGLVVASCSPKLHQLTFRQVARRAGMNPYEYTQVNIREQCSWAHTDDLEGATDKAIRLVRAGIARTRLSTPLQPIIVETVPKTLVIGGGIAGLRAAIGLADLGLAVYLVEKAPELGGWVGTLGRMYPHQKDGSRLIAHLVEEIHRRPNITVFTGAEVVSKSGSFGNHQAGIRVGEDVAQVEVGAIIVATGFDGYRPEVGELGYGREGVVTLPDFKRMIDETEGPLTYGGELVKAIAYVYCVGSREEPTAVNGRPANQYCSRYCCTATAHAALEVAGRGSPVRQYHLYRDIRTYGKFELLYTEAREKGSLYLKYPDAEPPSVERDAESGRLAVTVRDLLSGGERIRIPVDLVVLVTGMVPRKNEDLVKTLKLPLGKDGFFNEIHPKLRPVETVVDGVMICGACQAPKSSSESAASGLAAVTQAAAMLKRGSAELEPLIATIDPDACNCCAACQDACPYGAVGTLNVGGRAVAEIDAAVCKGCGACVPVCPTGAVNLQGYTDPQVRAMIDGMLEAV